MSRIGKQPINLPDNVEVTIDKAVIRVKGPKAELIHSLPPGIQIELKDRQILLSSLKQTKKNKALWGLHRMMLANLIKGVQDGFEKKLQIEGIGYRASVDNAQLILALGFSHPVVVKAPAGISFKVEKNIISISGADKQLVGQVAAIIRSKKKPEPYKGKGIRYIDEKVRRKAGKKAVATIK